MKQNEFLEVFNLLMLNYDKQIPDEIIRIWYDRFKNKTVDVFKKAIIDCIEEEQFFPTISIVQKRMEKFERRVL